VAAAPGYRLRIDIVTQTVTAPGGETYGFELDSFRRDCLIRGLDDIGLVLEQSEKIRLYEATARIQRPWLFPSVSTP
jgi:3-isopropylmalate/(R)-2-methylmalate dehydratase small subunit